MSRLSRLISTASRSITKMHEMAGRKIVRKLATRLTNTQRLRKRPLWKPQSAPDCGFLVAMEAYK
jgi:hypothetical protein